MLIINETRLLDTPIARHPATEFTRGTEVTMVVDDHVRRRLVDCPYAYYLNKLAWHFDEGILTLTGCVPTNCLKHALETLLRDIEYVERIINDVQIVSSTGLSSVWSRPSGQSAM